MAASRLALAATLLVALAGCRHDDPTPRIGPDAAGKAWPAADGLFHSDPRWLGADGAWSVELGNDRVLWLFGDTFVARQGATSRRGSAFPRNTIAVMVGSNPETANISFHWRRHRGEPISFFPTRNGDWYWPGDGERLPEGGPLLVFLLRIQHDPGGDPGFDFRHVRTDAVRIPNPDDDPGAWRLEPVFLPRNPWGISVGSGSVLVRDGWLYSYSTRAPPPHDAHLVRWRVDKAARGDLTQPEWWDGARRTFVPQDELTRPPAPLFTDGQPAFSVHAQPGGFVIVQTIGFGQASIGVRTAPALEGPWSEVIQVWQPPEAGRSGALVYHAVAHPELEAEGLAVTYSTNHDFETVLGDETLYYPRFLVLRAATTPASE